MQWKITEAEFLLATSPFLALWQNWKEVKKSVPACDCSLILSAFWARVTGLPFSLQLF